MFNLLKKGHLSAVMALLTLSTTSSLAANDCCDCNRFYIGVFGGELFSNTSRLRQTGTAFFLEDAGGPLAIDARGDTNTTSPGFGGVQVGYAWTECPYRIGCSSWSVVTGVEAEAFFYSESRDGELINVAQDRLDEHDFHDSFDLHAGVYVGNLIFTLNSCCLGKFSPYLGVGIGAAHLNARKADSFQFSPFEPGVNHFNSKRNDSDWVFAAQFKAGVGYCFCKCLHLFAEYRLLSLDPSRYTFGSTIYPSAVHVPTSPFTVDLGHVLYNGFAIGIQYDL